MWKGILWAYLNCSLNLDGRRRSTGPYGEYLLKKFDLFREEERRPPADGAGVGPETRSGCEQDTSAASAGVHTKAFFPFHFDLPPSSFIFLRFGALGMRGSLPAFYKCLIAYNHPINRQKPRVKYQKRGLKIGNSSLWRSLEKNLENVTFIFKSLLNDY